jgi:hypothetical protein
VAIFGVRNFVKAPRLVERGGIYCFSISLTIRSNRFL